VSLAFATSSTTGGGKTGDRDVETTRSDAEAVGQAGNVELNKILAEGDAADATPPRVDAEHWDPTCPNVMVVLLDWGGMEWKSSWTRTKAPGWNFVAVDDMREAAKWLRLKTSAPHVPIANMVIRSHGGDYQDGGMNVSAEATESTDEIYDFLTPASLGQLLEDPAARARLGIPDEVAPSAEFLANRPSEIDGDEHHAGCKTGEKLRFLEAQLEALLILASCLGPDANVMLSACGSGTGPGWKLPPVFLVAMARLFSHFQNGKAGGRIAMFANQGYTQILTGEGRMSPVVDKALSDPNHNNGWSAVEYTNKGKGVQQTGMYPNPATYDNTDDPAFGDRLELFMDSNGGFSYTLQKNALETEKDQLLEQRQEVLDELALHDKEKSDGAIAYYFTEMMRGLGIDEEIDVTRQIEAIKRKIEPHSIQRLMEVKR
jgi:hypothetical protein